MTPPLAPLFCSTRDVPSLLADAPLDTQEALTRHLELLQGGLIQPILRVADAGLATLLFGEARQDYPSLRSELREHLTRGVAQGTCAGLLRAARRRAAMLSLQRGVRARVGVTGVRVLRRYASWDPAACPDAVDHTGELASLDFALLGLACIAHELHRPVEWERAEWFVRAGEEALAVLEQLPELEPASRLAQPSSSVDSCELRSIPRGVSRCSDADGVEAAEVAVGAAGDSGGGDSEGDGAAVVGGSPGRQRRETAFWVRPLSLLGGL